MRKRHDSDGLRKVDASVRYPLLSIERLCAAKVVDHVEKNAHLYLWTTNSFMCEAHQVARAWGFEPKTILTWVKMKANNSRSPSMRAGFHYRSATEHILFCVRGRLKLLGPARPTAYMIPRILKHSEKPDFFYDLIEEQSPGPYLELFARRPRKGWTQTGKDLVKV